MARKIYMIYGAPATGKTTLAKFLLGSLPKARYVSRDLIRKSVPAHRVGDYDYDRSVAEKSIESFLQMGYDVIIDNVNLSPKDFNFVAECSQKFHAEVHLLTRQVPLMVTLERNSKRKDKAPIPQDYIVDMHNEQYKLTRGLCSARGIAYDIEKPYYHFTGIGLLE